MKLEKSLNFTEIGGWAQLKRYLYSKVPHSKRLRFSLFKEWAILQGMELLIQFLIFFTACGLIFKTTDFFVRGTVDLAEALRIPKVFIGVTLVSLVTTAPELIVSVTSSYLGESGMAVGNALGSCLCNISLVFGVGIFLKEVVVKKEDYKYKLSFLVGALLLVFGFIANGVLSLFEAIILLSVLTVFLVINYRLVLNERATIEDIIPHDKKKDLVRKGIFYFLIGGIGTVLLARYGMVTTGINIATALNIPPIIIGLSLVALGTSLPELFTVIISSRKGHSDIAFGNVVGANLLNLLFVLGTSAAVNPLTIDKQTIAFTMPALIAITLIMFILGFNNLKYSRKEGWVLLGCYSLYLFILFGFLY